MVVLLVVLGVVLLLAFLVIGIYNTLVALRQNVNQSVADIDAQLRQRHDLVPNLVETVKGYAGHEKETLDSVITARQQAASGPISSGDEQGLRIALDRLLALSEAYPDLKANANFQELQRELAHIEDKLAAARRALNASVSRYNTGRESFPAVIFASMFGFQPADFHKLDDSEKGVVDKAPAISFQ